MAVEAHTPVTFVHNGQRAVLDLSRYTVQPEGSSPEPSLSELMRREAAWRKSMEMPGSAAMSEADVRSSDTVMGLRGEDHAIWLVATNDKSPDAMAMISSYMENDSYREAFKGAIEDFYTKSEGSPDSIRTLDEVTDFVVPLVNEIESKQRAAALVADIQPEMAKEASDRKVIQGELIDHGAAPYQNKLGKEQSYFATVKTDAGNRTLWGAGLQETLQDAQVKSGDRVRIEDKGTVPVTLQLPQVDGSVLEKPGFRREWAAERMPVAAAIAVEAVTIVHNGGAVVLDPANSNDVVKYNDALTADVSFQADNIVSATQSLGELESMLETHYAAKRYEQANMLDSGAVSHGPEYVDKLNADIENVKSFLDKSKASLAEAQTSLQKLTPIATGLSSTAESPASLNFTHMGQQASLGLTPSATAMPAPLNFEPSDDVAPRDRDIHIGFLITDALASFVKVEADPDQKQTFIAYLGDEVIDRYGPGVTRDQAHGSAIGDAYAFFTHGQLIEKLTALELQGKAEAAPMSASLGQAEPEHDHGPELN
jgi:type IV secretion system protein VirB4